MADFRQQSGVARAHDGFMTTTFTIHPLPDEVVAGVRETGVDATGRPAEHWTAGGGEPVRCCLRNAKPGEELLLFGYQPPLPDSPYQGAGAVFVHAEECAGYADRHAYPADWYGRPQVLRAYDSRGWIHPASCVHDGHHPEPLIAAILATPGVVEVHSRNIAYGCYMFTAKA
jgi:hypothetical protein